MSFIRPVSWTRQPQIVVGVNWGNPLTLGLEFHAPFSLPQCFRDVVGNQAATTTGLGTWAPAKDGVYPVFGASNYADFTNLPRNISDTTPVTIAWTQEPRSTSAYSTVLDIKVTGAANSFVIFQSAADSGYYFAIGPRKSGSAISFSSAIGAATNNVVDRYLLQCLGGLMSQTASQYVLWRNGVRLTTSATTAFGASTTAGFRVGTLIGSTSDPFEGLIGDLSIWSRVLSDGQAAAWCRNPWELLAPITRRIWVPQSGAAPAFLGAWARGSTTLVGSGLPGG